MKMMTLTLTSCKNNGIKTLPHRMALETARQRRDAAIRAYDRARARGHRVAMAIMQYLCHELTQAIHHLEICSEEEAWDGHLLAYADALAARVPALDARLDPVSHPVSTQK